MNSITKLSFSYGDKPLFKNLSMSFNPGINFIDWESGKGKTTLLNLIADRHENTKFGSISFMQQDTILFEWMKAHSNLTYLSENVQTSAFLKVLGLDDKLEKNISELSGGQKRRLYLAMILNLDSDVYLLDEPFTGTDEKTINKILKHFTSMKEKTFIIASHKKNVVLGKIKKA